MGEARSMGTSRFAVFLVLCLGGSAMLGSCFQQGGAYPPPPQRGATSVAEQPEIGNFIEANGYGARAYFVKDVSETVEAASWRWTYARPQYRFRPQYSPGMKFVLDFVIPDVVFESTGPLTLTVTIDGKEFDKTRYDSPGRKNLTKAVPAGLLRDGETAVEAFLDKQRISEGDGKPLGYILLGAGFKN